MFIVVLTYKAPLEQIDAHMAEHLAFLERHYATGTFLASGRRVPRTGGVILARAESEDELKAILAEDPFQRFDLAKFELIAFTPTKAAKGLETLVEA